MLKQRVITAIVLLAVLLAALLAAGPWPLVIFLTVAAACVLWEWLRLTWLPGEAPDVVDIGASSFPSPSAGLSRPRQARALPLLAAALALIMLFALAWQWLSEHPAPWSLQARFAINRWLLPLVALAWVFGASALVYRGQTQARSASPVLSLFGIVAVLAVWASLVELFLLHGAGFLVSLLALIWSADIAAYFVGKAFGRRKLAPRVSPGKTWEGAIGGVVAATAWVMLTRYWDGSFGAVLSQHWPVWAVGVIAAFLAALSIVGDLFESLLKRRANVKDSSRLLPGHGGVYDRIDALFPVAPVALLLIGAT
jgi:phosphatidate cytidylyltransferase